MKLIPLDITLSTSIVRKTIRWEDINGNKCIKRNQVRIKIDLLGVYNNLFIPNAVYISSEGVHCYAVSSNTLILVENHFIKFILPKEIEIFCSSYNEL